MNATHLTTISGRDGRPLFGLRLAGVAVGADDRVYALGDTSVRCYSRTHEFLHEFELDALGWSLLAEEAAVWVGMDGKLQEYTLDGKPGAVVSDAGRLGRVTAIAAVEDFLVVADSTNRAVYRYSRNGDYLGELGAEANTRGFMIPNGVLDLVGDQRNSTVLVAHPQKHRVERYESSGPLAEKWGRFGMHSPGDFGGCCNPTNLAVAGSGVIAVSEKAPPRVKLYDEHGRFESIVDEGIFDPNTKNIDLAFDSRNRLYATDPVRKVIEVFQVHSAREATP
ncbi:MAG: hypothetical protein KDA37_08970 [Planctomycetales bacterium]|nr:hypothetical protein [Planctomycetales bacterium]